MNTLLMVADRLNYKEYLICQHEARTRAVRADSTTWRGRPSLLQLPYFTKNVCVSMSAAARRQGEGRHP